MTLLLLASRHAPAAGAQAACWAPAEAAAHVGERGCVEGTVTNALYASRANGRPTFLDFGPRFTAVIWGEDRPRFDPPPETLHGQRLRVSGPVTAFRGKAQIIVRGPEQLSPPGGPAPVLPSPADRTPLPSASPAPTPAVTAVPLSTAASPTPSPSPSPSPTVPPVETAPPLAVRALTPAAAEEAGAAAVGEAPGAGDTARPLAVAGAGLIALGAAGAAWYRLRRG